MKQKHLFILIVSLFLTTLSLQLKAGLKWVDIGVNGLTCSLCSRSVEMSLRKLDFIEKVDMSLEKTEGRIFIKAGKVVDMKRMASAVKDAGFSVRFFRLEFAFDDVTVDHNGSFVYQGQVYHWLQFENKPVRGEVALKLIDDGFLPRKESSELKKKLGFDNESTGQKIFHVVRDI